MGISAAHNNSALTTGCSDERSVVHRTTRSVGSPSAPRECAARLAVWPGNSDRAPVPATSRLQRSAGPTRSSAPRGLRVSSCRSELRAEDLLPEGHASGLVFLGVGGLHFAGERVAFVTEMSVSAFVQS